MVSRITQGIKLGWSYTVVKDLKRKAHEIYYDPQRLSTRNFENNEIAPKSDLVCSPYELRVPLEANAVSS